jgi:glycosyltransferase involved in cell wall biosynthesis
MKILEVINSLELAGAERQVHDLCLEFQRQGADVEVYLLKATGSPLEGALREAGIRLFASGLAQLRSPLQAARLAGHLRRHRYDAVHVHLFPAQFWAAVARATSDACFVTTEHSHTTRRRCRFGRPFDSWLYGRYDAVCCVSGSASESFRAWLPEYRERTLTVPNGIDLRRFPAGARPATRRLLSAGRCEPVKRHDVTLRALALIPEVSLWIAGDGPERPALEELARHLGVTERVQFLGRRPDLDTILPQCGVFVQSSDHEGFGLAALEAMACGLPVVCSDVAGLRDVTGATAMRFAAGDYASLAACLRSVLASPRQAEWMSQAGRERARSFSISATAEAYLGAFGVYA